MEYPLGPTQVDPLEVYEDQRKLGKKLSRLIIETESTTEKHIGPELVRNLSYWRGSFWKGDGYGSGWGGKSSARYFAERNETFPIIDTIVSSLAMDLPQVEAAKLSVNSYEKVTRETDPSVRGRRISAVLNWFAYQDDLDETVQELVLHSLLFRVGVMKVSWSSRLGRPIVRVKLPWEVFFDPGARKLRDASWAFERVVLHWKDFKDRVKSGIYKVDETSERQIRPDTYPRGLLDKQATNIEYYEQELRKLGLREYLSIVEFWDFRRKKVYHVHPNTRQILMEADMPYERPYEVLVFNNGVGRIDGIPLMSLLATNQQDINELVSARRQMVRRLVPRFVFDRAFWKDELDWNRFIDSKITTPTRVDVPNGRSLKEAYHVVEAPQTTYDFNRHLEDGTEGMRRIAGEADYQRGRTKNIRTAEEASALRSAVEGRNGKQVNRVIKVVTRMFDHMLGVTRWALTYPEASQIDLEEITLATQDDIGPELLRQDILDWSGKFRLLPFSPAMEDKLARRGHMERMLPFLIQMADKGFIESEELVRELVEEFGWRPSILGDGPAPQPQPGEPPPMASALPGAGGPPPLELIDGGGPQLPLPTPKLG